ncbi:hypothetical protein D3C79_927200 [compost metagenome]
MIWALRKTYDVLPKLKDEELRTVSINENYDVAGGAYTIVLGLHTNKQRYVVRYTITMQDAVALGYRVEERAVELITEQMKHNLTKEGVI